MQNLDENVEPCYNGKFETKKLGIMRIQKQLWAASWKEYANIKADLHVSTDF